MLKIMSSRNTMWLNCNKFIMRMKFKYLLVGSKETIVGMALIGLFPIVYANVIVYILLLLGIIPEFKVNVYSHITFIFSIAFLLFYSFFEEVLYYSYKEKVLMINLSAILTIAGSFIGPKLPL